MNFLKIMPKTLKSKLRIALFAIGFLPYLSLLIYTHNLGEKKILDNALETYHIQIREVKQRIEEQLLSLEKEMRFIASLDIMNDIVVGDVDKRIRQILIQKQEDLSFKLDIFALSSENKMIASTANNIKSDKNTMDKISKAVKEHKKHFFTKENIVMFTPIFSTLQNGEFLGYLCVKYALSNLSHFTVKEKGTRSLFYEPRKKLKIGEIYDEDLLSSIKEKDHDYIGDTYLLLHEQFEGVLSEWMIIYMLQKSVVLTFLDAFLYFLWGLFILGIIVIAITSLWISKRILEPIAQLSKATKSIISTQDYTTQVSIASQGEISELAHDFNVMIRETNQAFEVLEKENKLRLLRFVQLIEIFNRLINTQKEEECIRVAIDELQTFMPHQNFSFSSEYPDDSEKKHTIVLNVKDFDKQTNVFYGVIVLDAQTEINDLHEEKFYRSIATMIMLQLDHIRLIAQTQEVSSAKSTFISLMSHELRTPLHTILSASQYLIGYENLKPEQQEKVATMESSAHHLLGMINDILDLAKIEAGKVHALCTEHNSNEIEVLTRDIITMLGVLAEQKGIEITLENRLLNPMELKVDMRLLKQIIINLLSNAIKFTQEGSITFIIKAYENDLCIEIHDSGKGISEKDMERLFEDFTQVNNRSDAEEKGSGLGLAISRKLAHLFGADVFLESKGEGFGTTAVIRLKGN